MNSINLPTGLTLHGHHPRPAAVAHLLPRGCVSALRLKSAPTLIAPIVAEIAAGVATESHLCALTRRQGDDPLRSLSGLLRPSASHRSEMVAILTTGGVVDLQNSIEANVLARGVRTSLPIAIIRCIPDVGDIGAFDKIRAAEKAVGRQLGLIAVIADEARNASLMLASTFQNASVLLVTKTGADVSGARLTVTDDTLTYDPSPDMSAKPFQVKFSKDHIVIDDEPVTVLQSGPRRAWTPMAKPVANPVNPSPVGRPSNRDKATFIYLLPVSNNRQLTADELDLLGESSWTIDRATALKLAAQEIGNVVIAVVHAPDRDVAGYNANSNISWLSAEIRHQNLGDKIDVERAPFGIKFHGPDRVIAA